LIENDHPQVQNNHIESVQDKDEDDGKSLMKKPSKYNEDLKKEAIELARQLNNNSKAANSEAPPKNQNFSHVFSLIMIIKIDI